MSFAVDLPLVLRWWAALIVLGAIGWPMVRKIFGGWEQEGYLLAKIVGLLGVSLGVWWAGLVGIKPLSWPVIIVAGAMVAVVGYIRYNHHTPINWRRIIAEELIFGSLLIGWAWIKGHEPTINGLEKFMDYGFTRSILRSDSFPPADMWYAGESINYYYFGHLMMAVLTAISGVELAVGFNLMLATLFALCATMSFCIGRHLLGSLGEWRKLAGAVMIAYLVTMAGNMQTIYAFTKGYQGNEDNPPPFWEIMINPFSKAERQQGRDNYWYPNATRFIPFTIHEFPGYSFVVSDIHGHVLSIPLALLLIALLINMFGQHVKKYEWWELGMYGVVAGAAFMTNALDGPIYLGIFCALVIWEQLRLESHHYKAILNSLIPAGKKVVVVGGIFIVTVIPFLSSFKPFVNGVAVNCPPAALAGKTFGPIIFEEVEKCQKSPLWMLFVLWGLFIYGGIWLWRNWDDDSQIRKMLLIWAMYCLALIIFPEIFYFKDIYPAHFRSNTMFKLGYQVFIMMSILTGYVISMGLSKFKSNKWWILGAVPLVFLAVIYPTFSIKSYFGRLTTANYKGLEGLGWMKQRMPDDLLAVEWFNSYVKNQPVILEANGDSYTDYDRISTFTGLPTVAGWTVHEWLWRGGYGPIAGRAEEVRKIYEAKSAGEAMAILRKYEVEYIVIGDLERQKYPGLNEQLVSNLGQLVFQGERTRIYRII